MLYTLVIYTLLSRGAGIGITFYPQTFTDPGSCELVKQQLLAQAPFEGLFADGWDEDRVHAPRGRLFCVNTTLEAPKQVAP